MKCKIKYLLLVFPALLMWSCANMVTPSGGPKDTTPPRVTEAVPENRSLHFDGQKIELSFDEYITLENASQNILFSPPLSSKPDIKLHNKTVVIKLKEALKPNTTYSIDFGGAIKDLHEGNVFKDYVYLFSTGELLDTLSLVGSVVAAEDKKAVSDLFVGLYAECDSVFYLPTTRMPDFVTKTDKDGKFRINGLPDRPFLVFALKDVNSNLVFDMPNEEVAFLDTLVYPSDSLDLNLYSFTEVDTTQMLLERKLVEEGLLRFAFRQPADKVSIVLPDSLPDAFQTIRVWSNAHDTLFMYFTPGILDSLAVDITYDTLINNKQKLSLVYKESSSRQGSDKKKLRIGNNLHNGMLFPGEDLLLKFTEPIVNYTLHDTSSFTLGDTVIYNEMVFEKADEYGKAYRLKEALADTLHYALNLTDSVFFSLRGYTNDSLSVSFKMAKASDLGNLFVEVVPGENQQVVVQLLDSRNRVVDSRIVDTVQRVEFTQLLPEKYQLRAILDADRNGKWSNGNYHRRFQPETIVDYKDPLEVKAGWDIDLDEPWKLK